MWEYRTLPFFFYLPFKSPRTFHWQFTALSQLRPPPPPPPQRKIREKIFRGEGELAYHPTSSSSSILLLGLLFIDTYVTFLFSALISKWSLILLLNVYKHVSYPFLVLLFRYILLWFNCCFRREFFSFFLATISHEMRFIHKLRRFTQELKRLSDRSSVIKRSESIRV